MDSIFPIFILLLLLSDSTRGTVEQPEITFEQLYTSGKNSYTDGQWMDCISFMRRAIEDFQYYESESLTCTQRCLKKVKGTVSAPSTFYSTLASLHAVSERALCILRCRRERLTSRRPNLNKRDVIYDMIERKPYDYLQLCYWNDNNLEMAVKSAYTFLVANPKHQQTIENLQFYMEQEGYADHMLVDLEAADYEKMFLSGIMAYDEMDWQTCVAHLETSLEEFLKEEGDCRLKCRDKVEWGSVDGNTDYEAILTSMQSSIIRCQHHCLHRLSWVNGHNYENLPARILEYTHFCNFKMLKSVDACRATANSLVLEDNPTMRWNKYNYRKLYAARAGYDLFEPDEKIVQFQTNRVLEERYLNFISRRFKYTNSEFPTEQADDYLPLKEEVYLKDDFDYDRMDSLLDKDLCSVLRSPIPNKHFEVAKKEAQLRISSMFPGTKDIFVSCGPPRHANCTRSVVTSIEAADCSQWLGPMHDGCVLLACIDD